MREPIRLSAEDRSFFRLVVEATYANPFSERRDGLDERIAGSREPSAGEVLPGALIETGERLDRLGGGGSWTLAEVCESDRESIELAILFVTFHAHRASFDALVARQMGKAEAVDAPFAARIVDELMRWGFEAERAHRSLGLFYQIHRAFRFISDSLVGESPAMRTLREALWNQVFTQDIARYERFLWNRMEDFSTLLLGETGTGKTAAAAAIGRSGFIAFDAERARFETGFEPLFSPLNLSEFPETLLESELFGHRQGAFTGAIESNEGVLARIPAHGAVFLDEIGELSTAHQVKLLRVLQDRRFRPLGGRSERFFEGRVIAATHRPIHRLRREGRFRDDFYYRLCSEEIVVPTLRRRLDERPAELELLTTRLVERVVGTRSNELVDPVLTAIARDVPDDHAWPGNVRELEQRIRRVLLTGEAGGAETSEGARENEAWLAGVEAGTLSVDDLLAEYCASLYARLGSYEEVGRRVGIDRRTVKRHVDRAPSGSPT